jgi:hypothetical protein
VPPEFEGMVWHDPWQCDPWVYSGREYCSLEYSCGGFAYGSSNCTFSDGDWFCSCQDNLQSATIQFGADAILEGEACRIASSLCLSRWPTTSATDCSNTEDEASNYCSQARHCSYQVDTESLIASKFGEDYSSCSYAGVNGEQYVTCGCSFSSLGEFSLPWNAGDTCDSASAACEAGLDEGSLGEIECQWSSSNSDIYSCSTTDRCTQSAIAGGIQVGLVRSQTTDCEADGEQWRCACADDAIVTLDANNARDACDLAKLDCQEMLESLR